VAAVDRAPLSVGFVLGRSFRIWTRNIVPFTIVSGVGFLPVFGIVALLPDAPITGAASILIAMACGAAVAVLWLAMPAAVVHGVLHELHGERASLRGCARAYAASLLPVMGVGLVLLLLGLCCSVATGFVLGVLARPEGRAADWFESLALILGGALVAGPYWVAVAAAAVEKKGVGASLRRSLQLTRGLRGRVFLIAVVTLGFAVGPTTVLAAYAREFPSWAQVTVPIILSGYGAVACAVGYHDLCHTDVEKLVDLFA